MHQVKDYHGRRTDVDVAMIVFLTQEMNSRGMLDIH